MSDIPDDVPEYCGVGFFGESIWQLDLTGLSEEELRELYPEAMERLEDES